MKTQTLSTALNHDAVPLRAALCFELSVPAADDALPEWVELLPAGTALTGRDGRSWLNDRPAQVLSAFAGNGADLPIDYEHATELKAPKGEEAPAAAWVKELRIAEGGAVQGRVEWTERGANAVRSREYRYLSPVFVFEKDSGRIVRLTSAALTNQPNLHLSALNHQQPHEEPPMLAAAIRQALGLPETATEADAVVAINSQKSELATAKNRAETPSLDKFVPRADYDAAQARASNAEAKLGDITKAQAEQAISAEIDAALKAGKITPATVEYHKASCRAEGGLERFREFVKQAPAIGGDSGLSGKQPDKATSLSAEEKAVCSMLGLTEEQFLKSKGA